jgi:hypothetical protein
MTEAERFSRFVTGLLKVPHAEIKEKLEEHKRKSRRRKRARALRASRVSGGSS